MKCTKCAKMGWESRAYIMAEAQTLVFCPDYYDESSNKVRNRNRNVRTTHYHCSNGHNWEEESRK